jgi:hypothetical protein
MRNFIAEMASIQRELITATDMRERAKAANEAGRQHEYRCNYEVSRLEQLREILRKEMEAAAR